jgi:hypothetical protein
MYSPNDSFKKLWKPDVRILIHSLIRQGLDASSCVLWHLWERFGKIRCLRLQNIYMLMKFKIEIMRTQYSKFLASLNICKIWGFHGGFYEECRLLGYKTPVRTSQATHYISATQPSQLMLCKIWGFHDSDYEECRLLGYKNPVRTSQETHYVSTTESSQLMLCEIWGFHGGHYEEWRLLDITPHGSCRNRRFGET